MEEGEWSETEKKGGEGVRGEVQEIEKRGRGEGMGEWRRRNG